jgi:hypothetical protein
LRRYNRLRQSFVDTATEHPGTGIQSTFLHICSMMEHVSPANHRLKENTNSHKSRANSGTNKVFKKLFHSY